MSRTWCPRLLRENWDEMKSVSIYSWLCHFSNNYKKNLNKEEMHQAKRLGIISPVFSFMMCDVSSLVISLNERILITFSLNPLCQPVHAGTLTLRSWGRQISPDIAKFSGYKIAPYWESQIYESLYKCMSLLGLPNKVPQLGDLLDVYYLIALEATSVRSTCGQGWFLLEAGRGYVPGLSCSFW